MGVGVWGLMANGTSALRILQGLGFRVGGLGSGV